MDGLKHILTSLLWCLAELVGRNWLQTAPHPQCEVYDEEASHSYDEYFHLKNSQLEELLSQQATIQQPGKNKH